MENLFNVKYTKMLSFSLVAEALMGLIYHHPLGENSSFVYEETGKVQPWGEDKEGPFRHLPYFHHYHLTLSKSQP